MLKSRYSEKRHIQCFNVESNDIQTIHTRRHSGILPT